MPSSHWENPTSKPTAKPAETGSYAKYVDVDALKASIKKRIRPVVPAAVLAVSVPGGCAEFLALDEFTDASDQCANEESVCDGKDDNCNGETDEGFDLGGSCTVGVGACETEGSLICSADGAEAVCDAEPGQPQAETCNGIDDDCDEETDEDPFTVNNTEYACTDPLVVIEEAPQEEAHKFQLYTDIGTKVTEGSMSNNGDCESAGIQALIGDDYEYRGWSSSPYIKFRTYFVDPSTTVEAEWSLSTGYSGPPSACIDGDGLEDAITFANNNNYWSSVTPTTGPCEETTPGEDHPHCVLHTIDLSEESLTGETPIVKLTFKTD